MQFTYEYLSDSNDYCMSEIADVTLEQVYDFLPRLDAKHITFLKLLSGHHYLRILATKVGRLNILAWTNNPDETLCLIDHDYRKRLFLMAFQSIYLNTKL
jgi:hypothetical protein